MIITTFDYYELTKQALDISGNWLKAKNQNRYKPERIYLGVLCELVFINYLQSIGKEFTGVDMLGYEFGKCTPDIIVGSTTIDVKAVNPEYNNKMVCNKVDADKLDVEYLVFVRFTNINLANIFFEKHEEVLKWKVADYEGNSNPNRLAYYKPIQA